LKSLGGLAFDDPLPDAAAKRCCATIIHGLPIVQANEATMECGFRLGSEFFGLPAHQACCAEVDLWGTQACSPWGPPVPPALPRAALRVWEAAA
jgi:hypothetical protein